MMFRRSQFFVLGVGLLFLAILPLSVVLDVHHTLAAWDHDGHQHSSFDICQWVQQHTNGSLTVAPPLFFGAEVLADLSLPVPQRLPSSPADDSASPRAPPVMR
ncbi:MAG: hypothetical protein D6690_04020 [Nitrospirae bacterium]|nr:MAG: hypothetical protein D6690_04020 [Nitrospirota bacterium]